MDMEHVVPQLLLGTPSDFPNTRRGPVSVGLPFLRVQVLLFAANASVRGETPVGCCAFVAAGLLVSRVDPWWAYRSDPRWTRLRVFDEKNRIVLFSQSG